MKVNYDSQTDAFAVTSAKTPAAENDEDTPGVIRDTARRVSMPGRTEYHVPPLVG